MATRTFALNTVPHVAEIGPHKLSFEPEVYGDEFLDAYEKLRNSQAELGVDLNDLGNVEPAKLRQVVGSLRVFLASLMLPESAAVFARWDVVAGGVAVGSYSEPGLAAKAAAEQEGATVKDESLRLPDRVLVELLEWAVELYGGGARPTGLSSGSAQASPSRGTRGRAALPSRG
ncbi:hypothetical protein [Streptomyces sp. NRRL S-350]|uniref:hypothetical protein n=1 Tax=Streptomyces sp. NRRL S-350 TaxID=1463902 RepID=UPI0004BF6F28|nr:hypothetical protein [Streptomyces sp. NRRL S-350]